MRFGRASSMCHALIIEDNMVISRGIMTQLELRGISSFDQVWNQPRARSAVKDHRPDLIVVGDLEANGFPATAVNDIAARSGAAILLAVADPDHAMELMGELDSREGVFALDEIDAAASAAHHARGKSARGAMMPASIREAIFARFAKSRRQTAAQAAQAL
ncbi:hypothetical protein EKN06_05330 [Croceicoccus ponticola]|uniref:Response regulator n=1 Tax=Croceicoccus ponticola TaxID=2217664 RepID=A0A437H1Z4_9SPHN|nr:hypothetical protein [Croceicoccus ponticola]RVQ69586.1 hypothetical protein EKN06_05330 [Croceicoccus ponticola]